MKKPRIVDAIEHIDENLITEAVSYKPKRNRIFTWAKWGAVAACFVGVMIVGISLLHGNHAELTSIGGVMRKYTNASVQSEEIAIEWGWEYKTVDEKFPTILYNRKKYTIKNALMNVNQDLLGEKLGFGEGIGYDIYTEKEYRTDFSVWQIDGVSSDLMIVVEMDGKFYPFQCSAYTPPAVLGKMLDDFSLSQMLVFDYFSVSVDGKEKGHYTLPDDKYIWQVLNDSRDSQFVGDNNDLNIGGDYITFMVTSEALGVYKQAFYVTEDGYVRTNIFNWAYTFYIGEDGAEDIISYAEKNAVKAEYEPYMYSLAGTLTEIGDGYILVDDAILCADEKDGMIFKILTTDPKISRYIECQKIGVGSIVVVSFTEPIQKNSGNVVYSAVSMNKGYFSDDGISVPE